MQPELGSHHSPQLDSRRLGRGLIGCLLGQLMRFQEMPLRFDLDHAAIAAAAWDEFAAGSPASEGSPLTWHEMQPVLENEWRQMLGDARSAASLSQPCSLAAWVRRLWTACRAADASSFALLKLQADGFPIRDAARKLEIGLRFAKKIAAETSERWNALSDEGRPRPC